MVDARPEDRLSPCLRSQARVTKPIEAEAAAGEVCSLSNTQIKGAAGSAGHCYPPPGAGIFKADHDIRYRQQPGSFLRPFNQTYRFTIQVVSNPNRLQFCFVL